MAKKETKKEEIVEEVKTTKKAKTKTVAKKEKVKKETTKKEKKIKPVIVEEEIVAEEQPKKKCPIKLIITLIVLVVISLVVYFIYPTIEFTKDNKLYVMTFKEDWLEWEENMCYDESYSYNKKRDISIYDWKLKARGPFKYFILEFKKGNVCASEYILEEEYIERVIKEAKIVENKDGVKLSKLIKNKEAIVGNTRYPWNDNHHYIGYELDGEYKEMYVSKNEEGLLIIQINNSDEGPKYIAYK